MPIYTIFNSKIPPILKPNPRNALQRCWCLMETHHNIFCKTSGPKDRECPLLLDPLKYLYENTTSCSMDSTHSNRRRISCLAQVCCGLAFRFPPLGWLLLYSDRLGFFGMHKPTRQHHPCPSSYHLCSDITDWVKMLSPCRFHQCGWYGTRNSDSMLAQQGYLIPSSYHLRSDIVFHGQEVTLSLPVRYPSGRTPSLQHH